jgi:hypothetical protein
MHKMNFYMLHISNTQPSPKFLNEVGGYNSQGTPNTACQHSFKRSCFSNAGLTSSSGPNLARPPKSFGADPVVETVFLPSNRITEPVPPEARDLYTTSIVYRFSIICIRGLLLALFGATESCKLSDAQMHLGLAESGSQSVKRLQT